MWAWSPCTVPVRRQQVEILPNALAAVGAAPPERHRTPPNGNGIVRLPTCGTGTPLGDPIEVNALGHALAAPLPRPIALGKWYSQIRAARMGMLDSQTDRPHHKLSCVQLL